jgi:hypothetical protein
MKKTLVLNIILVILLISGLLYAATEIQYFTAKSENDAVLLEWKTGFEDNLKSFEIERSASNLNNFITVGTVNAIGNNSYYYYRNELGAGASIYYYRLKLYDSNGNYTYSSTISVTHVISGIRSTWGSIKAIFR